MSRICGSPISFCLVSLTRLVALAGRTVQCGCERYGVSTFSRLVNSCCTRYRGRLGLFVSDKNQNFEILRFLMMKFFGDTDI